MNEIEVRQALQNEYDRLRDEFMIPIPARVELTTRKATGGHIEYNNVAHSILVSAHMPFAEQIQTLRHEAAHALCFSIYGPYTNHKPIFWTTAHKMGVNPERRYAPVTLEWVTRRAARKKRIYECPVCNTKITTLRRLKPGRYHKPCFKQRIPIRLVA